MSSIEGRIRHTLAEMAEATPVSSSPQFDPLRAPTGGVEDVQRRSGRVLMIAASLALVVAGAVAIAVVGSRDDAVPADATTSLRVEPDVAGPGDWVTVSGDTLWGWEAFLDRIDGDGRQRIWMLYPASDVGLAPQAPIDLRDDPDTGLMAVRAANPMNKFRIPDRAESGSYQICRIALTAGAELCVDLTIGASSDTP